MRTYSSSLSPIIHDSLSGTVSREFLTNGGDLARLSRIMGHSDVQVTAHSYARFVDDELAAAHDKFSPINSLVMREKDDQNDPDHQSIGFSSIYAVF